MDFPTHLWLTNATYLEGKKAVAIEFSRFNFRRMSKTPFFPSFFISEKVIDKKTLKEILSSSRMRFKISEEENSFRVTASTFSDLEILADLIFQEIGFRALVLSPEKQFLIENNWSYFDCFSFLSEENFVKSQDFIVPQAVLPLFFEPLHETLAQLVEEKQELAEKLSNSIALSNLLSIPITALPKTDFQKTEALLAKLFWKKGLDVKRPGESNLENGAKGFGPGFGGLAEIDFGGVWPILLTKPFYNLGPDSIDCDCCKSESTESINLLPNSLALVEMQQDGFFFESSLFSFSNTFHKLNQGKESRLRRKEEFCLSSVPIGPFFRNQKIEIPLTDAIKLEQEKMVKFLELKEMHWFCTKNESSISELVFEINKRIAEEEQKQDKMSFSSLKRHGVLGSGFLLKNPDFIFSQSLSKQAFLLLSGIPKHLCNEKSVFFSKTLCSAIEAIEAGILNNFEKFALEKESRVVSFGGEKALVKTETPYALIRQFSEKERIPLLLRARNR